MSPGQHLEQSLCLCRSPGPPKQISQGVLKHGHGTANTHRLSKTTFGTGKSNSGHLIQPGQKLMGKWVSGSRFRGLCEQNSGPPGISETNESLAGKDKSGARDLGQRVLEQGLVSDQSLGPAAKLLEGLAARGHKRGVSG